MLNGLWRSQGYGWLLELDTGAFTLHHVGAIDCLAAERGTRAEFEDSFDRIEARGDALTLHQAGDLTRQPFPGRRPQPEVALVLVQLVLAELLGHPDRADDRREYASQRTPARRQH